MLIGKFLGDVPLGYYDKAYKLMVLPVNSLANVISPVLHPVLSQHQDNPILVYNFYKKLTKFLGIIGIPLSIILFFNANEIILLFFGKQWIGSIQAFRYLSLAVWAQMIFAGANAIFLTFENTKYLFVSGMLSALEIAAAVLLGIFLLKSIDGVALFLMCALVLNVIQIHYFLVVKIIKISLLDFFLSLKIGLIIGIVILSFNLLFEYFFTFSNVVLSVILKLSVSGIIFLIMLIILKEYKNFIDVLKRQK